MVTAPLNETLFAVANIMGLCYDSDFNLSVDESSYDEGEGYSRQKMIQPVEVAAFSQTVISDPVACSASVVLDSNSIGDEKNQGNYGVE